MEQQKTRKLTKTRIITRNINAKASSTFRQICENIRQRLQNKEGNPLPFDRSLELEQLDKLIAFIDQKPKRIYWANKSIQIADAELQLRSNYLSWNQREWEKWQHILSKLQYALKEINRLSTNAIRRAYYQKRKEENAKFYQQISTLIRVSKTN